MEPFGHLAGAAGCIAHRRCDLSRSVIVQGPSTLTFRLPAPDPQFFYEPHGDRPRSCRDAAPRRRHEGDPRDRPLQDPELRSRQAPHPRAQPLLPRLVGGRATGRLPGRDRLPHDQAPGRGLPQPARRDGRPSDRVEANAAPPGLRHPAPSPGAPRPQAGDGVRVPECPAPALRRHSRPPGAQLRRRPKARGGAARGRVRAADLPDRPSDGVRDTGRTVLTRPRRMRVATGKLPI